MRTFILLIEVLVLIAVGAALSITSLTRDTLVATSPRSITISVDGRHRQVDTRTLPELEAKDPHSRNVP